MEVHLLQYRSEVRRNDEKRGKKTKAKGEEFSAVGGRQADEMLRCE